jgi:hypothetical protein
VARAIRGAGAAGVEVAHAEIGIDGKIVLVLSKQGEASVEASNGRNPWDEV